MAKESNIGLIVKNAGIDTVGTAFNTIVLFATSVVITRTIGVELFGKYSLSSSVFLVVGIFAVFGLNSGVVRLTSKYVVKRDASRVKGTLVSGIALSAALSITLTALLIMVAPVLASRVFSRIEGVDLVIRVHIIALPFYALMYVANGYTQGLKTLKYSVLVEYIVRPAVRLAATVALFLVGFRLFGVVFAAVFSFIVAAALAIYYARKCSPFSYRRTKTKYVTNELFFYSLPLVFARLMNTVIARSNTILVGYFSDPTATGLFGAAVTISPFISLSLLSFGKIFSPVISELWESGETKELESTFKTVSKWIFSIGFPVFIIVMLFSPSLLLVFGSDFPEAATTLRLLAVGQIINAIAGPVGLILTMTGRQKVNLANSIALAVINLALNIVMIPRWGIAGAGLATAISLTAINVVRIVEVKVLYGFTPFRVDLFKPVAAGVIAAAAVYLMNIRLDWHDVAHTLLLCGAFLVAYVMLLFLFGLREEKEVLLEVLGRRKARGNRQTEEDEPAGTDQGKRGRE